MFILFICIHYIHAMTRGWQLINRKNTLKEILGHIVIVQNSPNLLLRIHYV